MAKVKTSFFCQNCGTQHPQWQGQCRGCNEWNTLVEEVLEKQTNPIATPAKTVKRVAVPTHIDAVDLQQHQRMSTHDAELDRVLGGGIVPGAVVLLGGEPGIGKSTLLLQLSLQLNGKVLYVSGEESEQQIKMRAARMQNSNSNCYLLAETRTENILMQLAQQQADLVVIDSIQTLHTDTIDSGAGSVSQIKASAAALIAYAKAQQTPIVLVGHITKEGALAGPKILEHMVDTVLQFEGDRNHVYRILRAQKNRFGATSEIGIYQMQAQGLQVVDNPSSILLSEHASTLSGHAIAATIEGIRPLFVEVQALVSTAVYGTPQRNSTGFNSKRLNMLLAVLEKRAGFSLGTKDVFINIAGGLHVEDAALDLAVVAAILSSDLDSTLSNTIAFAAEVGLSGEIRPVAQLEQRIREAAKLGFKTVVVSKFSSVQTEEKNIRIQAFEKIEEVVAFLFS